MGVWRGMLEYSVSLQCIAPEQYTVHVRTAAPSWESEDEATDVAVSISGNTSLLITHVTLDVKVSVESWALRN